MLHVFVNIDKKQFEVPPRYIGKPKSDQEQSDAIWCVARRRSIRELSACTLHSKPLRCQQNCKIIFTCFGALLLMSN